MKRSLVLAIAAFGATACSDIVTSQYATLADAEADRLFLRGWLPKVLPPTAVNIQVSNDLDLNLSWGSFEFSPGEYVLLEESLSAYETPEKPFTYVEDNSETHITRGYPAIKIQNPGSKWLFLCKPDEGRCTYSMETRRYE